MPRKYENMQERIIANSVHAADSAHEGSWCWLWVAKVKRNRAGVAYPVVSVRVSGKVQAKLAHRVSAEVFGGSRLVPGHVAKHLCNNTLCVNPAHIEGGTQKQNMRQMVAEGRDWYSRETVPNYMFNTGHVDAFTENDGDRRFWVAYPEEWYEGQSALNV